MKIDLAKTKTLYKQLPSPVLQPLTWLPFSLFCGKSYRAQLQDFSNYQQLSIEQKIEIRNKKLLQYANEAIQLTPFYQDIAKRLHISSISHIEQFFEFPVISKEHLSELDRFADQRFTKNRYLVTTGGTTGGQTRLYMSNDCYGREWAFVNDFLIRHGVNPDSKRLCLRGVEGIPPDKFTAYNPLYKEMLLSPFRLTHNRVSENIKKIRQFKPRWIHGYPSSVADFARILSQLGESLPSVSHVLLVSEKLYPDQEAQIRDVFGDGIITFYGLTERVVFAEQNQENFLPHPLYGATELIDGELVATGFLNQATRLLRYRTGDNAEAITENGFITQINAITGRRGREFMLGKNGAHITMTALNVHSDLLNSVTRYQFHQTDKGKCTLKLQTDQGFKKEKISEILNMFQMKVGNELEIEGKIVDEIPLTSRGKHRFIISEICT